MSPLVIENISDIFEAFHRDDYIGYMSESSECPDTEQQGYQHVFYSESPEIYLGLTVDPAVDVYEYRLSLRDEQKSYRFDSVKSFIDSIAPVIKVLTSEYLHTSNLTAFKYLIGFREDEGLLYTLGDHLEVETINPKEEASTTIMEDYPNTRGSVELGDLKGISPRTVYSREKGESVQIGSVFVFEGGFVTVNTSSSGEITNDVTPFLYSGAYNDYISNRVRRGWTDWEYLDGDIPREIMSRVI